MRPLPCFANAAFAAVVVIFAGTPALAQVDDAMLARLKSVMEEQGSMLSWATAEALPGGGTVLREATMTSGNSSISLPTMEISDVAAQDGGWKIGQLMIPSFVQKVDDTEIAASGTAVRNLVLPPEGQAAALMNYDGVSIRDLTYNVHRLEIARATDLRIDFTAAGEGPFAFTGAVDAFQVNLDSLDDPQTQATIDAMGYRNISGFITFDGSWHEANGRLAFDNYDITVKDAGTLSLSFDLAGVGLPFLVAAAQLQGQMAANPGGDQTMGLLSAMGLLSQMQLHSARIAFEDDSLTQRALAAFAKRNGLSEEAVAEGVVQAAEQWVGVVNDPGLTRTTRDAVERFLTNPRNIAVAIQPPAPLSGAAVAMSLLQGVPGLAKQLGVKVTANE